MVDAATPITNLTRYPEFASKTAFLTAFQDNLLRGGNNPDKWWEILCRLSNTDTDDWGDVAGDATARHDD